MSARREKFMGNIIAYIWNHQNARQNFDNIYWDNLRKVQTYDSPVRAGTSFTEEKYDVPPSE
jgi:hypothetical protein